MKIDTKKMSLADELRQTGTGLGSRAAAKLDEYERALRAGLAMCSCGEMFDPSEESACDTCREASAIDNAVERAAERYL